ncbi:MAG: glycosyltransferase family 39 protein [Robiginitomaculum sp.]
MTPVNTKPYALYTVMFLLGLMAVRIAALPFYSVGLHGDEAQYWSWAQDLDWGYFSKPPLIAWIIAVTTGIFGDSEWAVRLSSPIMHMLTAAMLYKTARFLWDSQTGFWAATLYSIMPGVSLSAGLVSTDVALLLLWAIALYAILRLREKPQWRWAIITGVTIGIGLLAKYSMAFFLPAIFGAIVIDAPTRRALFSLKGVAITLIAALILAPNMAWNAAHDFATLSHTASNTNPSAFGLHPLKLAEFWAAQMAVFGPLTLALYVMAIIAALRGKHIEGSGDKRRWLMLFILSPLILISIQALLSRANANWAVTTYSAGSLLTARYIVVVFKAKKFTALAVAVNIGLGAFVIASALSPSFANKAGQANAFKRLRGWEATQLAVERALSAGHEGQSFSALATDNRLHFYDLKYYGQTYYAVDGHPPLKMWLRRAHAHNHAEATQPLLASGADALPVLIINKYPDYEAMFRDDFTRLERLGEIDIDLGGGKRRRLKLWAGYGYAPTTTR